MSWTREWCLREKPGVCRRESVVFFDWTDSVLFHKLRPTLVASLSPANHLQNNGSRKAMLEIERERVKPRLAANYSFGLNKPVSLSQPRTPTRKNQAKKKTNSLLRSFHENLGSYSLSLVRFRSRTLSAWHASANFASSSFFHCLIRLSLPTHTHTHMCIHFPGQFADRKKEKERKTRRETIQVI